MTTALLTVWTGRCARAFLCTTLAICGFQTASAQPVPTDMPLDEPLGERVDFTIELAEGDEFAYRTRMDLRVEQTLPEGELAEQVLSYDVTSRFTVQGVDEDGTATIVMRVTRADVTIADGEDRLELEVRPLVEDEEYATPFASAIANTVVTLVVSPDGQITSVLGAEAYQEALDATEGADPRQIGFFNAEQIRDTFEPLFTIEELRDKPRRVGTGWATSREIELPPVAIIDLSYNWKLQGLLDDVATLTSQIEASVRRPNTPDPARPTVVLEGSSGNVVTQWDRAAKAVTRRISTLSMDTQWAMGDLEIGQSQQSTVRIERVPLGE